MTTPLTSASRLPASLLLAVSAALAAGNWHLQPGRAGSWAAALLLLVFLALVLWLAPGRVSRPAASRAAGSLTTSVAFAAAIMAASLGVKLAEALGLVEDGGLSQRLAMVILGASVAFTGNALPKALTPLSRQQCDAAGAQAVQRFTGWTLVLAGLAFAAVWLVLPPAMAEPVSVAIILAGGVAVMVRAIGQRRAHHNAACGER